MRAQAVTAGSTCQVVEKWAVFATRQACVFGTPVKSARVVMALNNCRVTDCADCWARGACRYFGEGDDYESLLEWLESEVRDD